MKLSPPPPIFMRQDILIMLGALSLLLGEVFGVLISEHHNTTRATTVEKPNINPVNHVNSVIVIFFVNESASAHTVYHGKGKP